MIDQNRKNWRPRQLSIVTGNSQPIQIHKGANLPRSMQIPVAPGTPPNSPLPAAAQRRITDNTAIRVGYRFSGGLVAKDFKLELPGDQRLLLGVAFLNGTFGTCTLMVNNAVVWRDVDTGFFQMGKNMEDYYAVNLPLNGNDNLVLTVTGDAAYSNQPFVVYYV